jgi:hypothetical protein
MSFIGSMIMVISAMENVVDVILGPNELRQKLEASWFV